MENAPLVAGTVAGADVTTSPTREVERVEYDGEMYACDLGDAGNLSRRG